MLSLNKDNLKEAYKIRRVTNKIFKIKEKEQIYGFEIKKDENFE